jgi:serine/threonine-protein kinase
MLLKNRYKKGELIKNLETGSISYVYDTYDDNKKYALREYLKNYRDEAIEDRRKSEPHAQFTDSNSGSVYAIREIINGRYIPLKYITTTDSNELFEVIDADLPGKKILAKKSIGKYRSLAENEVNILLSLDHMAIPKIHGAFKYGDAYYIIRDYVEGDSLYNVLKEKEMSFSEADVIDYCKQLCDIFIELHRTDNKVNQKPILHLDIKPGNIILDNSKPRKIRLIDFGTSMVDPNRAAAGHTPEFAAPEQHNKGPLDVRTDVYGFGATVFKLLKYRDPEIATTRMETRPAKAHKSPLMPQKNIISNGMCCIVNKCMEIDPNNRYDDFSQIKDDLENITPAALVYDKAIRHFRLRIAGVLIMALIGLAMISFGFLYNVYATIDEVNRNIISAEMYINFKSIPLAKQHIENARKLIESSDWGNHRVNLNHLEGRAHFYRHNEQSYRDAANFFLDVYMEQPDRVPNLRYLAVSLARAGQIDEARYYADILREYDPDGPESLFAIGEIYKASGDYTAAISYFERCYTANTVLSAHAYLSVADIKYRLNLSEEDGAALEARLIVLREARRNIPSEQTESMGLILDRLIISYREKAFIALDTTVRDGYLQNALRHSETYISIIEDNPRILWDMAASYRGLGSFERSRDILDIADRRLGPSSELFYQFAMTALSEQQSKITAGIVRRTDAVYDEFNYFAFKVIDIDPTGERARELIDTVRNNSDIRRSDPRWDSLIR